MYLGRPRCERSGSAAHIAHRTVRQKPQTAKGTLFIGLEDEAGTTQVIVWPQVYAEHRSTILRARLLAAACKRG